MTPIFRQRKTSDVLFGRAYVTARTRLKLRQGEVAKLAKIDQSHLAAIESGRRGVPTKDNVEKLLMALDLSDAQCRKFWMLAAVDRMLDAAEPYEKACDSISQVATMLRQIAEFGETELAFLETVFSALAKQRSEQLEKF